MNRFLLLAMAAMLLTATVGCRSMGGWWPWSGGNCGCGFGYGYDMGTPIYGGQVIDGGAYMPPSTSLQKPPMPGPEGT